MSKDKERLVDPDLQEIRQELIRMGLEVEGMLTQAIRGLTERVLTDIQEVPERDRIVDELEKRIHERCITILARHQSAAIDLRFVVSVIRVIGQLERIGDSSKNIAASAEILVRQPELKPYVDLPRMARIAGQMIRDSLDSFLQKDSDRAREVCQRDDEIDQLYDQCFRELLTFMAEDMSAITRGLHLLLVARNLERIADHATNIAEDTVYYIEARDIRHTPEGTGQGPTGLPG